MFNLYRHNYVGQLKIQDIVVVSATHIQRERGGGFPLLHVLISILCKLIFHQADDISPGMLVIDL